MKVLITGAAGFIGRHLIRALAERPDTQVFALSRRKQDIPGAIVLEGDVLNADRIEQLFCENMFDVVFHLAAITEHHKIVDEKAKTFRINLQGTIHLLESFNRHCSDAAFIYASTGKVYGQTNQMPFSETAYINPQNILGKTKRITEETIELYAQPENQYICARIFNIYGEGQKRSFVVPTIIDQLDKPAVTLGALNDLRDYLYIDDLISALLACADHAHRFAMYDVVNIGSGVPADVEDIIRILSELTNRKISVSVDASRLRQDETVVEFCSNQKMLELTGWRPCYSLKDGLRKTLEKEGVI